MIFPLILVYKPIAYGSYRFPFSCFTDNVWLIFVPTFFYIRENHEMHKQEKITVLQVLFSVLYSSSSCIEVELGIKLVSTQTKYRLIYALVYSNFFMRNGLHNFMSIYASQQVNHYKRLGTIEDRRFERKWIHLNFEHIAINTFRCVFVIFLVYVMRLVFGSHLFYFTLCIILSKWKHCFWAFLKGARN